MKDQQTCNRLVAVLFFLGDTVDIVGRFYAEMNEKKSLFVYIVHFLHVSCRKLIMIEIFYVILDFNY